MNTFGERIEVYNLDLKPGAAVVLKIGDQEIRGILQRDRDVWIINSVVEDMCTCGHVLDFHTTNDVCMYYSRRDGINCECDEFTSVTYDSDEEEGEPDHVCSTLEHIGDESKIWVDWTPDMGNGVVAMSENMSAYLQGRPSHAKPMPRITIDGHEITMTEGALNGIIKAFVYLQDSGKDFSKGLTAKGWCEEEI